MSKTYVEPFLNVLKRGAESVWEGSGALLAVSGGADSMALLRGMVELRTSRPLRLAVAHFNHQLQGHHADEVADWLRQSCKRLSVDFHLGAADVGRLAGESGRGIEETARDARYAFLEKTAREQEFPTVLVAHTYDDQAETILHHLLRGTGIAGLRGMPVRRPLAPPSPGQREIELLRPMLAVTRREALDYLQAISQDYRDDPSNLDVAFTRNRIRHELLPLLESSFNPNVRDVLVQLGGQAADLQDALEQVVARLLRDAVVDADEQIMRLHWQPLSDQPRHVIRECFAMVWKQQQWPRQRMTFAHYDRLAELTVTGGTATLPGGIAAERRGGLIVWRRPDGSGPPPGGDGG